MFLRKHGASGRFTFDIIYSCLQKSLRRGDMKLALEMAYEFGDEYANALRTRLIQNCSEDCPDLLLIDHIYNSPKTLKDMIAFIPAICRHMKCRDGMYALRLAVEMPWCFDVPTVVNKSVNVDDGHKHKKRKHKSASNARSGSNNTSMSTPTLLVNGAPPTLQHLCCIAWRHICEHKELEFISYFQPLYPTIKLKQIYKAIGSHLTFLTMLCVYATTEYMHESYTEDPNLFDEHYQFTNDLKLPNYVYDKHVGSSPANQKTYAFFISNCVIAPRQPETDIERRGKELYIQTNKGVGSSIRPVIDCTVIDPSTVKLIQTQLITSKFKPRVWYMSVDGGRTYTSILKGPFKSKSEIDVLLVSDKLKNEFLSPTPRYTSEIVSISNACYFKQNCLIHINADETTTTSSKLESEVTIYNGNHYFFDHSDMELMSDDEQIELLLTLAFRKVIGTNDTCCRNLIRINGHIYTIDDPALYTTTPLMFKAAVPKKYLSIYKSALDRSFGYITDKLAEWHAKVDTLPYVVGDQKRFVKEMCEYLADEQSWEFA